MNTFRYVVEIDANTVHDAASVLNQCLQSPGPLVGATIQSVYLLNATSGVDGVTVEWSS
jgi:hypothetical protein